LKCAELNPLNAKFNHIKERPGLYFDREMFIDLETSALRAPSNDASTQKFMHKGVWEPHERQISVYPE